MANYDTIDDLTDVIDNALATGALSGVTGAMISQILNNYTGDSALENAFQEANVTQTTLADIKSPVVVMGKGASFDATIGADSPVKAVIAATDSNNNNITFTTNADVAVQLGGGHSDKVTTAGGNDAVTFVGGSGSDATILTGDGSDTVTLQAYSATDNGGSVDVNLGTGDDIVQIRGWGMGEGSSGKATIDGGSGFDMVEAVGQSRADHNITIDKDGNVVMNSANIVLKNVDIIAFTDDAVTQAQEVTVIAHDAVASTAAKLYEVVLGRQPIDAGCSVDQQLEGINFWTQDFTAGSSDPLHYTVGMFMGCPEVTGKYAGMTNQEFVAQLFFNVSRLDGFHYQEQLGKTFDQYVQELGNANDTVDIMSDAAINVVQQIANSEQTVNILGSDGIDYVIDDFGPNTTA